MALLPALIAQGATAADSSQPILPLTAYDQAIAALSARPAALSAAFWGGKQSGGQPIDRVTGVAWNLKTAAPTPIAADAAFPSIAPGGGSVNAPSLDFSQNVNAGLSSALGLASSSWSVAMVVIPPSNTLTGSYALALQYDSSLFGASVQMTQTQLQANCKYGNGASLMTVARSSVIREGAPNIIVVSGDAVTRELAMYVNSKTPIRSGAAFGPTTWPVLSGTAGYWNCMNSGGASTATPGKLAQFAVFNEALHTDAKAQQKLLNLIQAAADTYGITLS